MICLVWRKIYMFFESRFKQRCWEQRVGAGEEEWTFFSIQVSNIQEVFPDCNNFKGGKPNAAAFSQILRWSWTPHPSAPPPIQQPFTNSALRLRDVICQDGWSPRKKCSQSWLKFWMLKSEIFTHTFIERISDSWKNSTHGWHWTHFVFYFPSIGLS